MISEVPLNEVMMLFLVKVEKSFRSNTVAKLASVGGLGTSTGGKAVLSISFFRLSEIIQCNQTSISIEH
jgi:hypothetical protein